MILRVIGHFKFPLTAGWLQAVCGKFTDSLVPQKMLEMERWSIAQGSLGSLGSLGKLCGIVWNMDSTHNYDAFRAFLF